MTYEKIAELALTEVGNNDACCASVNTDAEDGMLDLFLHDRRFHNGRFNPKTMTCNLRNRLLKKDEADDITGEVQMPKGISVEVGDITKESTDAIVNAANKYMLGGGGVDGAIHRAAGPSLVEECRQYPPDENGYRVLTGEAKITGSGNLPCKKVIHTAGPDLGSLYGKDLDVDEELKTGKLLRSSYRNSLQLAKDNGLKSVAFPSISTGIFGYPLDKASQYAAEEIVRFRKDNPDMKVKMCIFDPSPEKTKELVAAYEKAFKKANAEFGTRDDSMAQDEDDSETSIPSDSSSSSQPPTDLQKHDAKYHPNGYNPGDNCKYRENLAKGDEADQLDPENVDGEEAPESDEQKQKTSTSTPQSLAKAVSDAKDKVDAELQKTPIDFGALQKALSEYEDAYDAATGGKAVSSLKNLLAGLKNQNGVMAGIYQRQIKALQQASAANSLPKGTKAPQEIKNEAALSLAKALGANLNAAVPEPPVSSPVVAPAAQQSTATSAPAPASTPAQPPKPIQFGPKPALDNDESSFPQASEFNFAQYGRSSAGYTNPHVGSTHPHSIVINGQKYWVKQAGNSSNYTNKAASNEVASNKFIRMAGFNAPESKLYTENGVNYCVTKDAPFSGAANASNSAAEMREAYPLMSLLYSTDAMKNDNTKRDSNGMVFIDNGSSFGFSAVGKRPNPNIPWDYDSRIEPDSTKNPQSGIMALLSHPAQEEWKKAYGNPDQDDVLKEAAKYDMGGLVKEAAKMGLLDHLPAKGQKALQQFADNLDALSSKFKTNAASVPTSTTPTGTQQQTPVSQNLGTPASATTPQPATSNGSGPFQNIAWSSVPRMSNAKNVFATSSVPAAFVQAFNSAVSGGNPSSVASIMGPSWNYGLAPVTGSNNAATGQVALVLLGLGTKTPQSFTASSPALLQFSPFVPGYIKQVSNGAIVYTPISQQPTQQTTSTPATPSSSAQSPNTSQWATNPGMVQSWLASGQNGNPGPKLHSSWTTSSGRSHTNAMGIMTALSALANSQRMRPQISSALNSILTNGSFVPNARGVGGVVMGANLPRKGIVALQKQFNQALNPNGYQMKVHNNGVITFSTMRGPRTSQSANTPSVATTPAPKVSASNTGTPSQPYQTPSPAQTASTSTTNVNPMPPKVASVLASMAANNPNLASVYNKVAAKMNGGATPGVVSNNVPQASPAQPAAASQTPPSAKPTPTAPNTPTGGNATSGNKGIKHLQSLMQLNPRAASIYQSAINKLNQAGIQ